MKNALGKLIREKREILLSFDTKYSLRQIAAGIGLEPSYLSRIERGKVPRPSETTLTMLAKTLGLDRDELLALAGKISKDVRQVIIRRPALMAGLVRRFAKVSGKGIQRAVLRARRTGKH